MALMTAESVRAVTKIGFSTVRVNGHLTGRQRKGERSFYRTMADISEVLGRIQERLDALNLKAATASRKAGLSEDAIRNLRRAAAGEIGHRQGVTTRTITQLAPVLGVTPGWLLGEEEAAPYEADEGEHLEARETVPIVGYVGAGAEAHYYAVQGDALDRVSAPHNATRNTVAVEIRGESLGRLFDRWLAFYDKVHRPVTSDLVGRLCVVGLTDDRVLIKKIRKNRTGGYDLISEHGEPIEGADIQWAAPVITMTPR